MHNRKLEKWLPNYIFLKITALSAMALRLLFLPLLLSFKITDYNEGIRTVPRWTFPRRYFPDGQFLDRQFPERQFLERRISQRDISPMDSSLNDISPNGHFPESHTSFQE